MNVGVVYISSGAQALAVVQRCCNSLEESALQPTFQLLGTHSFRMLMEHLTLDKPVN